MDLVYFGYTWEPESSKLEREFIKEIKTAFPEIRLENAYDDIKGHRQSVFIEESKADDYLVYIMAHGWLNCSMTLQLLMYDNKKKFEELFERIKKEYPECLKNS